jgi:hypothetical protein
MTLFKLIFEHDMVLEPVEQTGRYRKKSFSIEDFMKPQKIYSRFYFSATDLQKQHFGLSASKDAALLFEAFVAAVGSNQYHLQGDQSVTTLENALTIAEEGSGIVMIPEGNTAEVSVFPDIGPESSFRDHITELTEILDKGHRVLFKVKAHHGYDLHLFSKDNIYRSFFYAFQPLIRPDLRFFSINGKRAKSERLFYFETWSLQHPPHGFEEVFSDTAYY